VEIGLKKLCKIWKAKKTSTYFTNLSGIKRFLKKLNLEKLNS